jgi:hypothetical protein
VNPSKPAFLSSKRPLPAALRCFAAEAATA